MNVTVTHFSYWKSEHGQAGCEDAAAYAADRGVFAVADGVSTTAFSAPWACHLVEQFLRAPLLSDDPFEVDWWLGKAQADYQPPDLKSLPAGTLREKAAEGSASTLATLRFTEVAEAEAIADWLTVGDSCVLVATAPPHQPGFSAFPLSEGADFDAHPMCLHSLRFDRARTGASQGRLTLRAGDSIVLATDAVARWVLAGSRLHGLSPAAALRTIAETPVDQWGHFVTQCRQRKEMADDDSTALVLHMAGGVAPPRAIGEPVERGPFDLGITTGLPGGVRQERQQRLQQALNSRDSVQIARLAGDVARNGLDLTGCDLARVRADATGVTQAMAAVIAALNEDPCVPESVRQAWQRQATLLEVEPAAARLRRTLIEEGFLPPENVDSVLTSA